jgi:predicted negative regulator of RcsB-dependent stress response
MTFLSTAISTSQANSAANKASQAYQQALTQVQNTLTANNKQVTSLMNPYVQSGVTNLNMLNSALNPLATENYSAPTMASANPETYLQGLAGMVKGGK